MTKALTIAYMIIFGVVSVAAVMVFISSLFDGKAGYIPGISFGTLIFSGLLVIVLYKALENMDE
jgi:hypothetical protein